MIVDVQSPNFGLGELLGATFRLLKLQCVPLLKVFLPLVGLVVLVAGIFAAAVFGAIQVTGFYNPQKIDSVPTIIQLAGIGVTVIAVMVIASIMYMAAIQVTADSCAGQSPLSTKIILQRAWDRVPAQWATVLILFMLGVALMSPIMVFFLAAKILNLDSSILSAAALLLVLLEMPLLYAAAVYVSLTLEAVALRNLSGMSAIRYSYSLVKGRFWKTLGYVIVLALVGWAIAFVPMMIIQAVMGGAATVFQYNIAAMIVVMVPGAVGMIVLQFLFYLFFYTGHTLIFLKWESSKSLQ